MSGWQKIRDDIKAGPVSATGKRVVLVEGDDDKDAFGAILGRHSPEWETKWTFEPANGKQNVTAILAEEAGWLGVIDRDEWTDSQVTQNTAALANLWVLPRFCLECYLVNPDELWNALPTIQQQRIAGGATQLGRAILSDISRWIRHGALWSVVNPMWEGLFNLGFQRELLDVNTAQDDVMIQNKLNEWHDFLDPTQAFTDFTARLTAVDGLPVEDQLCRWVHGKMFFSQTVVPALNRLLDQKSADDWRRDVFKTLPVPSDMDPLWQKMGLA